MTIVKTIDDCRSERWKRGRVALVPTMGALHAGHLSLIELAHKQDASVAVSIFVNPTQFGPREDYNKYPRPIADDLAKCGRAKVDFVFLPSAEEMYGPGLAEVVIDLPQLTSILEGKHRPGHFRGVCQVVAKLFNIVKPDVAIFGQKDFQQLRVITAMVEALDWPIDILPAPTMRDPDGMAMSSRNQYLDAEDRRRGLALSKALFAAQAEFDAGVNQTNRLLTTMQRILLEPHIYIDYIAAVDAITLKNVEVITTPTVLAVAARVNDVRLIDNVVLGAK